MFRIEKKYYNNFYTIFEEIDNYVGTLAVLDGISKGIVYADDAKNPSIAIMLTDDGYFLTGKLDNEEMNQSLFNLSQSDIFEDFKGILFDSKNLVDVKNIFHQHTYKFIKRNSYELEQPDFNKIPNTFGELYFVKVTPENLMDFKEYRNFQTLHDSCSCFWGEYKKNPKFNFCIAIIMDKSIVSKCILCHESVSKNSCELDVETIESFRHKGFAITVVNETIKEAYRLGYKKIIWNCDTDNLGSRKIAERFKFKKSNETYMAWFRKNL